MEAGLLNATFVANAAACCKRVVAHTTRISTNQRRSAHYGRCHSGFGGGISSFRVAAGKSISCSAGGQLVKERVLPSYYEKNPASYDEKDEGPKPNGTKVQGVSSSEGLGIVGFLKGKNFLVTGATGFVGKVFIEKILRTKPEVGKLFLLIRGKGKSGPADRLKKEIINSELFRCLRDVHGDSYEAFMLSKLAPIDGDVVDDDLGMDAKVAADIRSMVDVIVNSAANTTFDERYDVAFNINTRGPYRLMKFAAKCTRLKLFLHVSTAFVNGQRQGSIAEKPFQLGDSIARERFVSSSSSSSLSSSLLTLDVEAELNSPVGRLMSNLQDKQETQRMKEFGLQMARIYGWQDTYVFTKAMGEMAIDSIKGSVPIVIVRPSVVESTSAEPFPGWMQGNRMMDPIILYYGKGQISCFLADPKGVLDVVPADMVVNAMLAAMAKHGGKVTPGTHVYHVASSVINPLVFEDLVAMLHDHFTSSPHVDSKGRAMEVPEMKLYVSWDEFAAHVWKDFMHKPGQLSQRLESVLLKSVEQAKNLARIYEPYTFYGGRFDNTNTQTLMVEMSEDERIRFGFNVANIDWKDYIINVHIPGLRSYVMKGRGTSTHSPGRPT